SLGCEAPDQCWVGQDEIWVKTFTPDKPFIVYPNPVTDKLTIEFHINPEGAEIEILNLTGQAMITTRISPNRDILELDISQLSKGLYILKVTMPGKRPVMEKVVVQ
ncbi:MAG: T9SS type A sorting domain-containing protein, partial [Bacteroidales bacterium]|nr:T9SS type A sorting domain-containing protein [Bacteroidales bacterium]